MKKGEEIYCTKRKGGTPYLPSYDGVDINSENTTVAPMVFFHSVAVWSFLYYCPALPPPPTSSIRFMELAGIYMKRLLITSGK